MGLRLPKLCVALAAAAFLAFSAATTASSRVVRAQDGGLAVKPRALNFGAVRGTKTKTVVLTNTSADPLPLSAGWAAGAPLDAGFAFPTGDSCLQSENEILAPGASCTITFAFSPGAADAHATFAFSVDGWATTAATVSLRAKSVG
jgi:hypothetical protein